MSVKVSGLADVLQALERDLPHAARDLSGELMRDVANAIAELAAEWAPKQRGRLTIAIKSRKSPDDPTHAEVYVRRGRGGAFYWRFLEYGDGPDGVEHAFFLRAQEAVVHGDGPHIDKFKRRLTARLKRL